MLVKFFRKLFRFGDRRDIIPGQVWDDVATSYNPFEGTRVIVVAVQGGHVDMRFGNKRHREYGSSGTLSVTTFRAIFKYVGDNIQDHGGELFYD